jgi:hypothetical protein
MHAHAASSTAVSGALATGAPVGASAGQAWLLHGVTAAASAMNERLASMLTSRATAQPGGASLRTAATLPSEPAAPLPELAAAKLLSDMPVQANESASGQDWRWAQPSGGAAAHTLALGIASACRAARGRTSDDVFSWRCVAPSAHCPLHALAWVHMYVTGG